MEILDPTYGDDTNEFALADRLTALDGATVGFVSNGKRGTVDFFDSLEQQLVEHFGVARVVRVSKSNYSAPADESIFDRAKQWSALVAGVGD